MRNRYDIGIPRDYEHYEAAYTLWLGYMRQLGGTRKATAAQKQLAALCVRMDCRIRELDGRKYAGENINEDVQIKMINTLHRHLNTLFGNSLGIAPAPKPTAPVEQPESSLYEYLMSKAKSTAAPEEPESPYRDMYETEIQYCNEIAARHSDNKPDKEWLKILRERASESNANERNSADAEACSIANAKDQQGSAPSDG